VPGDIRKAGKAKPENWLQFDQTEFFTGEVGFQRAGWVYVPERCRDLNNQGPGSAPCKLVVRPDKCDPAAGTFAADAAAFADYAEGNGLVVLHPCMGGAVDSGLYPYAPDIVAGKLDVYGQLDTNYVHQSSPHMAAIGAMVRRVLGTAKMQHSTPAAAAATGAAASVAVSVGPEHGAFVYHIGLPPAVGAKDDAPTPWARKALANPTVVKMPTLKIDRGPGDILVAGCSNTADFSAQFHTAFSALVKGSCIFSGMPYHCAVTRFPNDYMVAKSLSTAAGIHCEGCDANGTLAYDHCKNHPTWVDVETLADFAKKAPHIDDPTIHLADARVFAFGPTHDR
jgi:hypothetical protein